MGLPRVARYGPGRRPGYSGQEGCIEEAVLRSGDGESHADCFGGLTGPSRAIPSNTKETGTRLKCSVWVRWDGLVKGFR